jgi:hypothetical protein
MVVVVGEAALQVLRRLQADPSTRMEAFLWEEMVRAGADFLGMTDVDVELDPDFEDELAAVLRELDYLDDGPLPDGTVEGLIRMLEERGSDRTL